MNVVRVFFFFGPSVFFLSFFFPVRKILSFKDKSLWSATLITILTIENRNSWQSLLTWQLIVTLDSIRNSCNVSSMSASHIGKNMILMLPLWSMYLQQFDHDKAHEYREWNIDLKRMNVCVAEKSDEYLYLYFRLIGCVAQRVLPLKMFPWPAISASLGSRPP